MKAETATEQEARNMTIDEKKITGPKNDQPRGTSRYHRKYYVEKYKRPTERELDDAMEILKRAKYNQ